MKKVISLILVLTFVMCAGIFSFADSGEWTGVAHKIGNWSIIDGGVSASAEANQHLVFDKKLSEGAVELTLSGDWVGTNKMNGVFVKGSQMDKVTQVGWQYIENGQDGDPDIGGLGYYMIYLSNEEIHLVNMYDGKYRGTLDVKGNITGQQHDSGAWKNDKQVVIRVEFFENGKVKVYAEGSLTIDYTPADSNYPKGNQIGLRGMNSGSAVNFTDIQVGETTNWVSGYSDGWRLNGDEVTNFNKSHSYVYNTDVNVTSGTIEFDMEGEGVAAGGNPGVFFGGNKLYGDKNAESGNVDQDYWMLFFTAEGAHLHALYDGAWKNQKELKTVVIKDALADKKLSVKIEFTSTTVKLYVDGSATPVIDSALPEGAAALTGGELAFRSWGNAPITFSNLKINGEAVVAPDQAITISEAPDTGDSSALFIGVAALSVITAGAVLTISKKRTVA